MNPHPNTPRATLVVVDPQPLEFKAARHPVFQRNVTDAVLQAVARGWDIVLVQYEGAGSALSEITEALALYERTDTVQKTTDGGGNEVWEALAHNHFVAERLFICGVNTHGCVQDTVSELAELLPESDIAVVKSACNDVGGNYWNAFDCPQGTRLVEAL